MKIDNINTNLSKKELSVINRNIKSAQMQFRAINVFKFMKELIDKNDGKLRVSIRELNNLYQIENFKFSDTVMRRIIIELINLNLLYIDKEQTGTVYRLYEKDF